MKRTIAALAACSASLWAQRPDPAKHIGEQKQLLVQGAGDGPEVGFVTVHDAMAGPGAIVAGAPYSAEAVTERIQTLLDGNQIVQTISSTVARDSQGRVRRSESLGMALPGGKGDGPKFEIIDDPVARVHWTLDLQSKTAAKMPFPKKGDHLFNTALPPPPGPENTWFYAAGAPGAPVTIQTFSKRKAEADSNVSRVDLGTQNIEGVSAQGTRVTRTIPTGAIGNEQPLVITSETWYSPDLKVLVMSKSEDPRMGVTTYRLTNIQRGEPLPSLFEIPADYTIKDQPGMFLYKEAKKPE